MCRVPLINIMAVTPGGATFKRAINTSGERKSANYIAEVGVIPQTLAHVHPSLLLQLLTLLPITAGADEGHR